MNQRQSEEAARNIWVGSESNNPDFNTEQLHFARVNKDIVPEHAWFSGRDDNSRGMEGNGITIKNVRYIVRTLASFTRLGVTVGSSTVVLDFDPAKKVMETDREDVRHR